MMRGLHRRQRGLTLLELLVAFAIMALSLGMLYRAMGSSARSVADVDRYQRAVVLAESLLSLRDAIPEQGLNQSGSPQATSGASPRRPMRRSSKGPPSRLCTR